MGLLTGTNYDLGVGSYLGQADGELSADLHARLDVALSYLANWYKATDGSDNQGVYWAKIDDTRSRVETAERTINASDVFPSTAEVNLYNDASASFADTWQTLYLSIDTLPQPGLLNQAADAVTTVIEMPSTIITKAAGLVGSTLGDATKQFFLGAWPFLVFGGIGLAVYIFRKPLTRLVGSVS